MKKSLKIKELHKKGYDPSTMGGASYMFHVDIFDQDRLAKLKGNDKYFLNIVFDEEDDKIEYNICIGYYKEGLQDYSMWREEYEFSKTEIKKIKDFIKESDLEKDVENLREEYCSTDTSLSNDSKLIFQFLKENNLTIVQLSSPEVQKKLLDFLDSKMK